MGVVRYPKGLLYFFAMGNLNGHLEGLNFIFEFCN